MKKSEKKRLREELEKFDSEEIRKKIERSREIPEIGRGIIKKRKETNTNEELEEMVSEILFHSIIIIMLGFFYFGAVPQYFGVNDEFINPSNSSIGYGNIGNMTNDAFIRVSSTLHESGASHPIFYFWFWGCGVWCGVGLYWVVFVVGSTKQTNFPNPYEFSINYLVLLF